MMRSFAIAFWTVVAITAPGSVNAQQWYSPTKIDGSVWITRAMIPPQTTFSYTGTALFRSDGTLGGAPRDGTGSSTTTGVWIRSGYQDYSFTFTGDVYDSSGNFVNTNVVAGTMHVSDDGLTATGTSLLQILDTTGKILFQQPAANPTPFKANRITAGTLPNP
jgi:hypothetical protein